MTTYRCTCGARLISAEEVGRVLNSHEPLTQASARKVMTCADIPDIPEIRGYPSDRVHADAIRRPGKGRWGHK
jgi:hypothetical protein